MSQWPTGKSWHNSWDMDYKIAQAGFYDSAQTPPAFGHAMLAHFSLETGYVNLNNGSYGTVPRPVTRFCSELTNKVEANPDRYHRFSFKPLLVDARESVARMIGAGTDECVFVSNATAGVNTVMRNLEWSEGDIIVQTSTTWQSTSRVLTYMSDVRPYPMLSTFKLTFPTTHEAILDAFRAHIKGLKSNLAKSVPIVKLDPASTSAPVPVTGKRAASKSYIKPDPDAYTLASSTSNPSSPSSHSSSLFSFSRAHTTSTSTSPSSTPAPSSLSNPPASSPSSPSHTPATITKHSSSPRPLAPTYTPPAPRILAVIDSIVALPAARMPWKEMVAICREEGVLSLVDAAHSLGQEQGINLGETRPDFWISTCHKWLYSRRGSAVLYVPFRNQYLIKTSVPTSSNYVSPRDPPGAREGPGAASNFVSQHEWPGAVDFTSYLCVPTSIEFRNWLGGEEKINAYCRCLAIDGGRRLAKLFGTRVMDETPDAQLTLNMTNIQLPLPTVIKSRALRTEVNDFLELSLLREYNVFAVTFYHGDAFWVRCSAQVFNDMSDFERLGGALLELCKEARETLLRDFS